MLKGIVNISFAVLFLFTSSGVVLNKHYCSNRLVSSSIFLTPKNCCNGHCNKCHNETKVYKITDNYQNSNFSLNLNQYYNDLIKIPVAFCLISFNETFSATKYITDTSPPPGSRLSSFLQVFRL
jgi:hypothetical protein